jgi:aspartate ammonia-lyase
MRTEHDSISVVSIPDTAYWGSQTQRAIDNFHVSSIPESAHPELIRAYALVQLAAVEENLSRGWMPGWKHDLIAWACMSLSAITSDRDSDGRRWMDQFPVDVLQGGAGTSLNMNVNEVIANLALEHGGWPRGSYGVVSPVDDVNMSQSTNDTYPTALRIALAWKLHDLERVITTVVEDLDRIAGRHENAVTIGRTQLQDAVPITYGRIFSAYARQLEGDEHRVAGVVEELRAIPLGGTAVGTGINAPAGYAEGTVKRLAGLTNLALTPSVDPVADMTDMGVMIDASNAMRVIATHLRKLADDMRLLASGPRAGLGEVILPAVQAGSSIMPGKVNPVIMESIDQVVFTVNGLDHTIMDAAQAGQLQLNAFEPVIAHSLLDEESVLEHGMIMLSGKALHELTVREDVGRRYAGSSLTLATFLNTTLGYDTAARIAHSASMSGRTIIEELVEEGVSIPEALRKYDFDDRDDGPDEVKAS